MDLSFLNEVNKIEKNVESYLIFFLFTIDWYHFGS